MTVDNVNSKSYSAGNGDGVKYSANTQYTINIPAGLFVKEAKFEGYDNYAGMDAYIFEVNGQEYGETDYVFPMNGRIGGGLTRTMPLTPRSLPWTPMAITPTLRCTLTASWRI